jgi:hypothetical protein
MRMKCFADVGAFCGFAAGVPADPGADRVIRIMLLSSGKQPCSWFTGQSAIMLPEFFEQMGTKYHIAILTALTILNMENHALGVDVCDLQICQLGSSDSGGIEGHQDSAVKRVRRGVD